MRANIYCQQTDKIHVKTHQMKDKAYMLTSTITNNSYDACPLTYIEIGEHVAETSIVQWKAQERESSSR